MHNPSLIIVVLEGDRDAMLIRRYLRNCGIENRRIRIEPSPSGAGSAEKWVRKKFVKEVNVCRSRHAKTALIVMIDADTHSVQDRLTQFDQELKNSGKQAVDNREHIARLVPKRNVETWILCLDDQTVDEEHDYKPSGNDWNKLIPPAAKILYQWTHAAAEIPDKCIGSLRSGVIELKRLDF